MTEGKMGKIEELMRIVKRDEKVLRTVLQFARATRFERNRALRELRRIVEEDEHVLDTVLNYARSVKK